MFALASVHQRHYTGEMTRSGITDLSDVIAIGLLLAATAALALWCVVLRLKNLRFDRLLAETRQELAGANNRLAQARDRAALMSNRDPVTGLLVRHVIVERFMLLLTQAQRHGTTFGILLVGLTDFEQVSDRLGNEAADQLLQALGHRLLTATRDTDTVSRIRDHEFAVLSSLLPSTGLDVIISKLRAELEAPFTLPRTDQMVSVTAHFGSASYPQDGADWTSIMKAADNRLLLSRFQ